MNKEQYYDTSLVQYEIVGINTGDTIPAKSSVTYTIAFTFTSPDVNESMYEIDGEYRQVTSHSTVGSLLAHAIVSSGDLTGSNSICAYQLEVINTYSVPKTFTISATDSSKFVVTDSSGVSPLEYTIPANTSTTYDFYLMKANGAQYGANTQRVDIVINDGNSSSPANYVIALVDQNVFYPDTTAPYISGVSATILNDEGSVLVSWTGTDNVAIDHYTVIVFDSSNQEVKRVSTADPSISTTITGLSDGNYYFTVIGYDTADPSNTASTQEIADATTERGHACRTNEEFYDWNFTVTYHLSNTSYSSSQGTSVKRGETYQTTLNSYNNYYLPESITVTMVGNSNVDYTYTRNTGSVAIRSVTGDIEITASSIYGTCLAFGTEILLADGTNKKIEDITYEDLLCVYDHVNGEFTAVYPIWIEVPSTSSCYDRITFSDGSFLDIVNHHSLYNVDLKKYVDTKNRDELGVGSKIYKVENQELSIVTIEKIETIEEPVQYTNIVTPMLYNIIANHILTTDLNSSISNIYGFDDNAIYSDNYQTILEGPKLSYELMADYFPYYLYKGLNLQNAYSLLNNTFNYEFISSFIMENTILPKKIGNKFCFFASIQRKDEIERFDLIEGTLLKLPDDGANYYIETSTGKKYKPNEEVKIDYSMHFKAVYE